MSYAEELENAGAWRAVLEDRAVLGVSGTDAASFLQGIVTNDVTKAQDGRAVFAALLTPQGKILFDFMIHGHADGFLLDCAASIAADLAKRLSFYKLRAKVSVEDVSDRFCVAAMWGAAAPGAGEGSPDPRHPALGRRVILPRDASSDSGEAAAYEAHRIALAIPEGGKDYAFGDTFPHEACFDLLNGVDFHKGCFVGQEVVSRMQHRGTARTRVVAVMGERELQPHCDITADGFVIGRLGSVAGTRGIALLRLDRAAKSMARGEAIESGGIPVRLAVPEWATYSLEPAASEVDA